jgi:hypothetical protein
MAELVRDSPVTETTDRGFAASVLLLARIRRLVIAVILAGLAYSLSVVNKAICAPNRRCLTGHPRDRIRSSIRSPSAA